VLGFTADTSLETMLDEVIPWIVTAVENGTLISSQRAGFRDTMWRIRSAPSVTASPTRKVTAPLTWCFTRSDGSAARTPKVKWRFSSVLAIALTPSAIVLAM
jgi:hypothetical protein